MREAPGFDPFKVQSDADILKSDYPLPLRFAPGEKWEYGNVGYYALAEIIRMVSGQLLDADNWLALRPSGAFMSTVLDLANGTRFSTPTTFAGLYAPPNREPLSQPFFGFGPL